MPLTELAQMLSKLSAKGEGGEKLPVTMVTIELFTSKAEGEKVWGRAMCPEAIDIVNASGLHN